MCAPNTWNSTKIIMLQGSAIFHHFSNQMFLLFLQLLMERVLLPLLDMCLFGDHFSCLSFYYKLYFFIQVSKCHYL